MPDPRPDDAALCRQIVRSARKAALATIDAQSGAPYASLVAVASAIDARPVTLLSTLARHSTNLAADPRASLLFEGPAAGGDVLAGGRVSLMGRLHKSGDGAGRRRFLACHPEAAGYADFADFAVHVLTVDEVHYVGGFGRIKTMAGDAFLLSAADCAGLAAMEESAVAHMNADHAEAIDLYATALLGAAGGGWRLAALDPEGADLVRDGEARRLSFPEPVHAAGRLRHILAELAETARGVADRA